ncbi:MAG: phosphoglucosamine mutase [Clostridiales bacterium]|nr:phosphoglucosamine mutase [Clostridiales bacterium]
MSRYFGTDGFRGEANVDLTIDHAIKIGLFLGNYYGNDKKAKIVIGKDTRLSSYMFEDALAAGLTAAGADAYLLHVTTTPSVSFVTRTEGFDCGIMISASHNPYYDNGIKLINARGEKMEDEVLRACEDYLDGVSGPLPYAQRDDIGKTIDHFAGRNRYIGYLISLARNSYKGMRVGLDGANGSAWMIAKSVFDALGATTFAINCEPNGTNINRDAGSTHMEHLQRHVLENKLDVGFAFDGDADRCLAVDELGNVVNGDQIVYVYGRHMHNKGNLPDKTVVTTIMSNLGLSKALEEIGLKSVRTDVGDKYVTECMRKNNHLLGGEQSGHIIFAKYASTGDGVLTAIKIMQAIIEDEKTLSKLCEPCRMYPQILKNVWVDDKDAAFNDPLVVQATKAAEASLGDRGRVLLRKSGTEPLLRVMAEAEDARECEEAVDSIVEALRLSRHI